ncbi:hypothetical protein MNEG_1569 [Monoraphidium neglectum]|jgi:hypothetical protein|uniref:Uncharacterized protein n=1 Tax=Monoraphidium neglectum TaxID=145388 RepID=A0A0D2N1H5_9CHLO|nr:hypothetical protein MNEG_1569 [Monoraphidium neglectum]KIZ06382.1 hypothetical protein MNEG_1569 [Monoraphidium neglectum]|eukprot:XP_013905401.1 hypothetical protein MNEG_1569 [Monoraphidium neglectum]
MGWWPFSKGPVEAKPLPKARQQQLDEDAQRLKKLQTAAAGGGSGDAKAVADMFASPVPRPASIFEFGKPVPLSSDHLVGNCAGDNPDAIQACTWTIEPLQGKSREKRPVYRIEF